MKYLILLLSLFLAPAFAGSVAMFPKQHWYFGFDIGGGINYYQPADNVVDVHNADHPSFAFGFHLGDRFSKYIGAELGYLNFGSYENGGNGPAICNTSGDCNYEKPDLSKGVFRTHLTVRNDVLVQSVYAGLTLNLPYKNNDFYLLTAVSYARASIHSFVNIDVPLLNPLGLDFQEEERIKNSDYFKPFLAFGWRNRLSRRLALLANVFVSAPTKMYRTRHVLDGTIYPVAITLGVEYTL